MKDAAAVIVLTTFALTGCSNTNQALWASGGYSDFAAMGPVTEEWGDAPADATVPIMVGESQYSFHVWLHKTKPRIMVQTAALGATATASFLRGLTSGIVSGDQDYQPFEDAAVSYLATARGPGCRLQNSRKITRIGFQWDYDCAPGTPPTVQRLRRKPTT